MLNIIQGGMPNTFSVAPGEAWGQGFATYGGYVAAATYRACRMAGHDRPLLSAQINFMGPAPVEGFDIEIDALRVGRGTSVIEARVWAPKTEDQDARLTTKILFTLGDARPASLAVSQQLNVSQLEEFKKGRDRTPDTPALKGVIPGFIQKFQFRPFVNGIPFAAGSQTHHAIAFKPRFDLEESAAEILLLISDINPPPQLTLLDLPCPASTASWMITIEHPLPETLAKDWFYILIELDSAGGGYGNHSSMIFDAQGCHVSSNRQTTAVFEADGGKRPLKSLPKHLAFRAGFNLLRAAFRIRAQFSNNR